jgi:hypothetical protein
VAPAGQAQLAQQRGAGVARGFVGEVDAAHQRVRRQVLVMHLDARAALGRAKLEAGIELRPRVGPVFVEELEAEHAPADRLRIDLHAVSEVLNRDLATAREDHAVEVPTLCAQRPAGVGLDA